MRIALSTVYTNVGRLGAPIEFRLFDGDATVESRTLTPSATLERIWFHRIAGDGRTVAVFLGPVSPEVLDAHTVRNPANGQLIRKAVRAESVSELPEEWFGYDAVDLAVLTVGDGGPFDEYCEAFGRR